MFFLVVAEVQSAAKVLLCDQDNSKRLLKRCKILQTIVKRVCNCFVDDKNIAAKNVEISAQPEPLGNVFLDHIINRGKQILNDRSILYKTPVKTGNQYHQQKEVPLFRLVHLKNLSFMNESSRNQKSIDLHITGI